MNRFMDDLRDAVASVKDHYAGKITLRTSKVPKLRPISMSGTRVRRIRSRVHMSQEVFARCLHTSRRTIEKWEQGSSSPTGTAAALLALLDKHPEYVAELAEVG
ncbi:MAG: helix-turn-helix domain-containing protein [Planctomycetes bacterium]|nr:helix-turn-helix domain-containing protein [Planctomycetota bacterium]